jgi:hypothetical protein
MEGVSGIGVSGASERLATDPLGRESVNGLAYGARLAHRTSAACPLTTVHSLQEVLLDPKSARLPACPRPAGFGPNRAGERA